MNITLNGIVCILLWSILVVHCRFRLYALATMPLCMILLKQFQFFGFYERLNLLVEVDFLLLFSFCIFLFAYAIGKRLHIESVERFYTKLSHCALTDDKVFISHRYINAYFLLVISYCIFDLWLNTQLYGSLENALTRFYAKPMNEDFPSFLKTVQGFLFKGLTAFIFVFRFYSNKHHQKSSIFNATILLLVLIAIPAGSRGAAISPMLLIIIADIFSFTFLKGISLSDKIKEYAIIGMFSIFIFFSLTMVRGINFDDVQDMYETVSELNMKEANDSYSEGEGDLILHDVQFSYTKFGKEIPFLSPFYTLETLLLAPIPRALMPSKKVSYGYVLNEVKLGGSSLEPNELNYPGAVGWAAGLAGEGWANGGLLGVTLYALLFGLYSGFCSRMYYKLFKISTPLSVLFALLFFQMSYNFIRGDLLAGYVQGIYPLLIITFIFYIIRCFKRYKLSIKHFSVV